jgi:predicted acetyltransferase
VPAEIRAITPDEHADWAATMASVFLAEPPSPAERELTRQTIDFSRARGAFDATGRVVATCRSFPTTLTVPGGTAPPTHALSNVTVLPTHRRQGLLTGMLEADLADAVERGEPVSALIAAEWPIYGRFGYGPAVQRVAYEVDTRSAAFVHGGGGTVAIVEPAQARPHTPAVEAAVRRGAPGSIERPAHYFDWQLGLVDESIRQRAWKGTVALHYDDAGAVDGYVRWHADSHWDGMRPSGTLHVDELLAATASANARLWRLVCEVDLVTTVRADDRPVGDALPHLLRDGRAARVVRAEDLEWVRLLDVCAALEARRYPAAGRLVVEVVDPYGWASGRYALDGGPDGASCRRTDAAPDLTLPVQALGSAYLGGYRMRTLATAGLVDEHTAGALARADAVLGPLEPPWMLTFF